jgi:hypothetical protein
MIKRILLVVLCLVFISLCKAIAQDTLPNFTTRYLAKNKVQVSWINPFNKMVQLVVQRSFDSTKYFKSIFSSQSPWLPQNGFVDNNTPVGYKVYYRVQYVFEGGAYFFTPSKSPSNYVAIKATTINNNKDDKDEPKDESKPTNKKDSSAIEEKKPIRYVKIYKPNKDSFITTLEYKDYKRYRDSINNTTNDTIQNTYDDDEIIIKPFIPKPVWKASTHIFTSEKGFIRILLPLAKQHKYRIVFFEENNEELFQIKHAKEADLVLDKSNFYKAAWYYFELYEDEKLVEKNKFYVSRDRDR